jgi:MFS family permease
MIEALRSPTVRRFSLTQFLLEVQFWFPIWLVFLLDLGFPLTTAVLADATFRVVSLCCELPAGILADKIGRRRTYRLTALLSVLTFTVISQVNSLGSLLTAWALWGVLWALASGSSAAYLHDLIVRDALGIDAGKAFGLVRAVGSVAVLVSLLTAGVLYEMDPRAPFAITAGLAALALLLTARLPEVEHPRSSATLRSVTRDIRWAARIPPLRLVVALGILLLVFGWSVRILFQPFALDLGLAASQIGAMYAALAGAALIGGVVAGQTRPAHRHRAVIVAFLLVLVAIAAIGLAPGLGPLVLLPMFSFGYAWGWTVLEITVNRFAPGTVRATVFSLIATVGGVGIALARPALGLAADRWSVVAAFGLWTVAGVPIVALAALLARRLGTFHSATVV